jgi:nicotinamide riboside kinase
MRLVFAGTQSVGKTTLVHDLAAAWPHARIEEEPIRAVARLTGEPPPAIPTRAAERRLIDYGLGRLRAAAEAPSPGEVVLFDRSPLDAYAHAILSMETGGEIDPAFLAEMRPRVVEALSLAHLVVLVPMEVGIGNQADGFRYLDESNRRRVDAILHDLLRPAAALCDRPVLIVRGDRPSRVAQISRAIGGLP